MALGQGHFWQGDWAPVRAFLSFGLFPCCSLFVTCLVFHCSLATSWSFFLLFQKGTWLLLSLFHTWSSCPVFISQVLRASQGFSGSWIAQMRHASPPCPWGVWALAVMHLISDGIPPVLLKFLLVGPWQQLPELELPHGRHLQVLSGWIFWA